jgi:CHAT domain-containing protein
VRSPSLSPFLSGRYDEALEYHDRALTIFRDVKDLNNQGLSLMRSGDALQGMGRHAEELAQHPALFEGVDLLSLSACDTAVAGGEQGGGELEGFGMLAQRQGAKSVLATLWSVEDQSTRQIMAEFYRLRQAAPEKPKAEALRQAQLALLQGKRSAAMMQARRSAAPFAGEARERPPSDVRKGLYAHPYFWAPFVLIGNWR